MLFLTALGRRVGFTFVSPSRMAWLITGTLPIAVGLIGQVHRAPALRLKSTMSTRLSSAVTASVAAVAAVSGFHSKLTTPAPAPGCACIRPAEGRASTATANGLHRGPAPRVRSWPRRRLICAAMLAGGRRCHRSNAGSGMSIRAWRISTFSLLTKRTPVLSRQAVISVTLPPKTTAWLGASSISGSAPATTSAKFTIPPLAVAARTLFALPCRPALDRCHHLQPGLRTGGR